MLLVEWEPVPADLLRLNGKLPSGSRNGAGHVSPAASGSGKAAPALPKEELASLLFAQGERLTAHCFGDRSSLMSFGGSSKKKKKKSFLVSASFEESVGKKSCIARHKNTNRQPERRGKARTGPHVGNLAERSQNRPGRHRVAAR